MKNFKRLLVLALAIVMVFAVAGCNNSKTPVNDDKPTQAGNDNPSTDKIKIGLVQLVQHEALDAATQGFQDALVELIGADRLDFNLQNAAGDPTTCSTIVNQFVSSDVDLIFANATAALQAAVAGTADIPIVATAITSYEVALEEDDWANRTTGRNVTGTADLAPLNEQAAMFVELLPEAKNIGLIYCSSEANSKYQVDVVAEELAALGLNPTLYAFADSNDIAAVVTTAVAASDALYIPTDNTAASNTEIIANIAGPANVPIIASEEGICNGCGIATLSISYYDVGYAAGKMAYDILVNGADPADMEIGYVTDLTKKYVPSRMAQFGITPPEGYEALPE
ncbi:MAG: ABC transporter substrate-binding protein [Oscillospiraceae bacterium]|nr:ABC transporter substrate-binding protein [Oscillospiraceae bacterium]